MATHVSTAAAPAVPRFSLDRESQFDLSTYWGRVQHFASLVSLKNNLVSGEELQRRKALLQGFKESGGLLPPGASDADMWEARRKVSSVLHPDTGEPIPLPFRMSAFMPVNLPVTAGMLLSTTVPSQLFFQWLNQTYNSAFNYANRNATVPTDYAQLGLSYAVATGTAVGAAFGLGKVVSKLQARLGSGAAAGAGAGVAPPQSFGLKLLTRGMPWFAVATAGAVNALAMRYKEGIDGITIFDDQGRDAGKSVAAGRAALAQVALTRVVLPIPILLLPPFLLDVLRSAPGLGPLMASSKPARVGIELAVIAFFLQKALPFAVATFPQTGSISADKLEPQFRPLDGSNPSYTFNKGV